MIETIILEEPSARCRFRAAPCLQEREQYLFHLMRHGYGHDYLRSISGSMLQLLVIEVTTSVEIMLIDWRNAGEPIRPEDEIERLQDRRFSRIIVTDEDGVADE